MKKPLYLILIIGVALTAAALLILPTTTAPPIQLIQDMAAPHPSTRSAPPTGVVPFGTTAPAPLPAHQLYSYHCAACHGADGSGQSYVSHYSGMPSVGNLQSPTSDTAEQLRIIREGRGAMPAFGKRLSEAEILALHQHIHTHLLKK